MTPPHKSATQRTQDLETTEQLRTRVKELERQLADAQKAQAGQPHTSGMVVVVAVMGGALVVTTPLALATLKRWADWWRS
jgi:hypothetical protein